MRFDLAEKFAERGTYTATYQGTGRPGTREKDMLLLRFVTDVASGKEVADHLWINATPPFQALNLRIGDRIQFDGRVMLYMRANGIPDFRLGYPSKITKLDRVWQPPGKIRRPVIVEYARPRRAVGAV